MLLCNRNDNKLVFGKQKENQNLQSNKFNCPRCLVLVATHLLLLRLQACKQIRKKMHRSHNHCLNLFLKQQLLVMLLFVDWLMLQNDIQLNNFVLLKLLLLVQHHQIYKKSIQLFHQNKFLVLQHLCFQ